MENEIKKLPQKMMLQRRAIRIIILCAALLVINMHFTPDLNWALWITAGLGLSFALDFVDYIFVKRTNKNKE